MFQPSYHISHAAWPAQHSRWFRISSLSRASIEYFNSVSWSPNTCKRNSKLHASVSLDGLAETTREKWWSLADPHDFLVHSFLHYFLRACFESALYEVRYLSYKDLLNVNLFILDLLSKSVLIDVNISSLVLSFCVSYLSRRTICILSYSRVKSHSKLKLITKESLPPDNFNSSSRQEEKLCFGS